jgi:hypothetical protein
MYTTHTSTFFFTDKPKTSTENIKQGGGGKEEREPTPPLPLQHKKILNTEQQHNPFNHFEEENV